MHASVARGTAATLLGLVVAAPAPAAEQPWPVRPVRFIVNSAPGGAPDIIGRAVAQALAERIGQQVVVDNRAGASGIIGAEIAAQAAPDGHTALLASTTVFAMLPAMRNRLPFDVERDFAPVGLLASAANVVAIHAALPVKTVADLVQLAKSRPLLYASAGTGTPAHLAGEMMNLAAGVKMSHVPYKGAGPALADVLAGQVHLIITSPIAAVPHVAGGRVRLIATTGLQRDPLLPDLPPVAEVLPGYAITQWWGMVVPARTPLPLVQRLNQELQAVLRLPELRERLTQQGAVLRGGTAEQFGRFMAEERNRLGAAIRRAGIVLVD
jgi:tripartite-type tricarboxylate transporter receptor subunit TctC